MTCTGPYLRMFLPAFCVYGASFLHNYLLGNCIRLLLHSNHFIAAGVDLLGHCLKSTCGKKLIIVTINYLTRFAETQALAMCTESDVANFLLHNITLRHGAPRILLSDRGCCFTSAVVENLSACVRELTR